VSVGRWTGLAPVVERFFALPVPVKAFTVHIAVALLTAIGLSSLASATDRLPGDVSPGLRAASARCGARAALRAAGRRGLVRRRLLPARSTGARSALLARLGDAALRGRRLAGRGRCRRLALGTLRRLAAAMVVALSPRTS
jgi:hypothetical protein